MRPQMSRACLIWCCSDLEAGLVDRSNLVVSGDGIVHDMVATGLVGEADGEGALERLSAAKRPGASRSFLERYEAGCALLLNLHLRNGSAGDEDQVCGIASRADLDGELGAARADG